MGRFTSPDEFKGGFDDLDGKAAFAAGPIPYADIGDPQTLNKYTYVRNNPLRYIDPNGHCFWDACIAEGYATYVTVAAIGAGAVYLSTPQGQQNLRDAANSLIKGVGGLIALAKNNKPQQKSEQATDSSQDEASPNRKADGSQTEPKLPDKTIANEDGVEIKHYTRSGDHGPAHLHVEGEGAETRIGQNGKPLSGDPPLSSTQRDVVEANKGAIRKAVDQIQRWHRFNQQ